MINSESLIILNAVPGLGPVRIRQLVDRFGSACAVFRQSKNALIEEGGLPADVAEKVANGRHDDFLHQEMDLVRKHCATVITIADEAYPNLLKEITDPPTVLYVYGSGLVESECAVAMVGSRHSSVYGLTVAENFSSQLAQLGIAIVSGLAKGIDTAAHRGALRVGGRTLAVLGCGLTHIYPPENEKLFHRIAENGAVLSEFPMTMPPMPYHFPRRNRIVSGLSLGVVVVEASEKSGALITSRFAMEQGREVFAIPGQIGLLQTRGVHRLIQQGAKLVVSVEDILEELKVPLTASVRRVDGEKAGEIKNGNNLSDEENFIYTHIGVSPVAIDSLMETCRRSLEHIFRVLFHLELKGLIRQMPGCLVVRRKM